MVVGIKQIGAMVGVTCKMELNDSFGRNGVDIAMRVKAMVKGVDEDIVDVEQNAAVGFVDDRSQKLPFGKPRMRIGHVAGNIFDKYSAAEKILHFADSPRSVRHCFLGMRKRHQVVEIAPTDAGPTQMIRNPGRLDPPREC